MRLDLKEMLRDLYASAAAFDVAETVPCQLCCSLVRGFGLRVGSVR